MTYNHRVTHTHTHARTHARTHAHTHTPKQQNNKNRRKNKQTKPRRYEGILFGNFLFSHSSICNKMIFYKRRSNSDIMVSMESGHSHVHLWWGHSCLRNEAICLYDNHNSSTWIKSQLSTTIFHTDSRVRNTRGNVQQFSHQLVKTARRYGTRVP